MRTRDELSAGCAEILHNLRLKKGFSKFKMANFLELDDHTWARYEAGTSAPSVPDFLWFFERLGENALRPVLDFIYPDTYKGIDSHSSPAKLRNAAAHYFSVVASDRAVREWDFIVFGDHGSSYPSQLQEFTMIDHLPMEYRYAIAEMVDTFWRLAEERGELVATDHVMPDVEMFRDGLVKGRQAAVERKNAYTTGVK